MRFLDLDKLQVIKEYNFSTLTDTIKVSDNMPLSQVKELTKQMCQRLFYSNFIKIETFFDIQLEADFSDNFEEQFESFINVFTATFFDFICTSGGRKRERRLDVPERLKEKVRVSTSALKKAINYQTLIDKFNLRVTYFSADGGLYIYDLIDQDFADTMSNILPSEFVHDVDELGDSHE